MSSNRPTAITLLGLLTLAGLSTLGAGCNIIAAGTYLIAGGDKIEAVYKLDEAKTHVVFVDDRGGVVRQRAARDLIAAGAEEKLLEEKVVKDMIQGRQAIAASKTDRAGKLLTVAQIGAAVKAQRVIYANVDNFSLKPDGNTYQPTAVLSVKIIDVETGQKLFPGTDSGLDAYTFNVTFKERSEDAPGTFASELGEEQKFARAVGVRLAQLFYKHERIENAGDSLRDRRK